MPSILTRPSGGGGAGGGSVSVTLYSDAGLTTPITTADFAQTVYIKAVASGITPSGYVLKYPDRNGEYVETPSQVSDTFTHEAVNIGAGVYSIIADGTVVGSATLTTTIDLPIVNGKAVYGFYKMVDSYAGDCVRVRRFSDNSEQDFGFDNQRLDIDAIRTFAGDEGFAVTKVYNQLGNGDITQTVANSQPGIQELDHALFSPLYRSAVTFNASLTSGYGSGEQSTDHLVFSSNIAATVNSRVFTGTPINRRAVAIGIDGNNVPRISTQPSGIGGTDPVYIQNPTQFVMEQKTTSQNLWVDGNLEITATGTYTLDAITGYQYFRQDASFTLVNGANWFAHVSYENDKIDDIENILQKLFT